MGSQLLQIIYKSSFNSTNLFSFSQDIVLSHPSGLPGRRVYLGYFPQHLGLQSKF
jgi:hypothetical protein